MNEVEERFRKLCSEYYKDRCCLDQERPIVITPCGGYYGVAGYVIAINGSPPRALFWVEKGTWFDVHMISLKHSKLKRLLPYSPATGIQVRLRECIADLLKDHLLERSEGQ